MRTPLMTTLSAGCDLTHKRVAPCRLTGHRESAVTPTIVVRIPPANLVQAPQRQNNVDVMK
jgi:hypothetical protein